MDKLEEKERVKKVEAEKKNMNIYGNGRGFLGVERSRQWKWLVILLKWIATVNYLLTGETLIGIGVFLGGCIVIKYLI